MSLTMGDVGGKRVRRVRNARTKTEAAKLLRTMLAERDARSVEVGKVPTVATWMQTWLGICSGKLRDQTVIGYRQYDRLYVTEQLGKIRLDALTPEHIEVMYANMRQRGLASGSIHSCHRVLRASLGVAVKRGIIRTNPAAVAEPGRLIVPEFEPLSADEARLVLAAARGRRNGARWTVALALGLRQGRRWP